MGPQDVPVGFRRDPRTLDTQFEETTLIPTVISRQGGVFGTGGRRDLRVTVPEWFVRPRLWSRLPVSGTKGVSTRRPLDTEDGPSESPEVPPRSILEETSPLAKVGIKLEGEGRRCAKVPYS